MIPDETRDSVKLTPEELAAIDAATPYEEGKGYTAEQVLERAKKRTKAWIQAAETTR